MCENESMWTDLFKPYKLWLIETVMTIAAIVGIGIVARGVQASSTPLATFYLSGALAFAVLFGRWIERWSRNHR